MAERTSGGRRTGRRPAGGRRRASPLSRVLPLAAILLPLFLLVWRWDDIQNAGWSRNLVGAAIGVGIVVAVVVGVVRSQSRARAAAGPGGWGGLVMFHLEGMAGSPTLAEYAPKGGPLATILFARGVTGRLLVEDEVRFQPGPRAALFGAQPFTLTRKQVRNLGLKDRFLAVQVRGEKTTVLAKVVKKRGLIGAITRFMKQPAAK